MNAPYFLMADDNRGDIDLLEEALGVVRENRPVRIVRACDGRTAWDILAQLAKGDDMPKLVVLDLNLPYIKGAELAARMKGSTILCGIPSVIVSSGRVPSGMCGHVDACYEKPGTWQEYLDFARKLCVAYLGDAQPVSAKAMVG